eukprot:CAMPEP_0115097964 /NCGR_PEP_ID=MMETSP0227-20121206/30841_1 /TAXON_ID=89957 /ORGANISM="Polarella glacialis, Strain CCMP 1383" /LENGTH=321 /DNA_ID=CAMNT_0002492407 /DNA_START=15 /DNA_END=981 /DNA_ORIENTATION=-
MAPGDFQKSPRRSDENSENQPLQTQWNRLLGALEDFRAEAFEARLEAEAARKEAQDARAEAKRLQDAGCRLQSAYEALQRELREAAGDAAYWRVMLEEAEKEQQITTGRDAAVESAATTAAPPVRQARHSREGGREPLRTWTSLRSAASEEAIEAARAEAAQWRQLAERRGEELNRVRRQLLVPDMPSLPAAVASIGPTAAAEVAPRQQPQPSPQKERRVQRTLGPLFDSPTPMRAGLRLRPPDPSPEGRYALSLSAALEEHLCSTLYYDIASPQGTGLGLGRAKSAASFRRAPAPQSNASAASQRRQEPRTVLGALHTVR